MKATKSRKLTTLFLALVMTVGLFVIPTSAAGGAKLNFQFPDDVKPADVTLTVYEGYPASGGADNIKALPMVAKTGADYVIEKAGTYSYWVHGTGYYNICKIFNVTDADIAAGTKTIAVETGKLAGNGFEPTNPELKNAPASFAQDSRDGVLVIWPDEILKPYFSTETLKGYTPFQTPYFTIDRADHQFTTQDELMAFLKAKDNASDSMYLYSLGTTPVYSYDMPVAVFTETKIPAGSTLKQAGELLQANGKVTVWVQSQIHPNEPASGEGALAIINDLVGAYGKDVLSKINVLVIPRINPDGSYLFTRTTYQGFDMNRDHLALKAPELAFLHTAYSYFMPEVVADGHEFTFYGATAKPGFMNNADDLQVTPASSLNNNADVNALAEKVVDDLHVKTTDAGIRVYHYGYTVNNPIGRAYYGLFNSISILIETRGIGAGSTNFERRVFSQYLTIKSIIDSSVANATEIQKAVADARADVIKMGATYEESDTVILHQVASGDTQSPRALTRYQYSIDGKQEPVTAAKTLSMNDTVVRARTRPTAYVIPKDAANLDKILYILDNQGAEYYELAAGSSAQLQQYYYVGEYKYNDKAAGFEADLRDNASVTFAAGAYVIPMDQVSANVIAMTMEPDVNDSNGYDGTLVQFGLVSHDETSKNYPIYRYTGNNPRTTLVSNAAEPKPEPKPEPMPEPKPEPEPMPEPMPTPEGSYVVKAGDSLSKIAKTQLGDATKWNVIYQANKAIIKNANMIYIGQTLVIPGM